MKSHRQMTEEDLIARLESMPFKEARKKILHRRLGSYFDSSNHRLCLSWLLEKESSRKDVRDEETLLIAKDANLIASDALSIARRQLRYAAWAAIVAMTAAITANKDQIFEIISTIIN